MKNIIAKYLKNFPKLLNNKKGAVKRTPKKIVKKGAIKNPKPDGTLGKDYSGY